jgi:hypothetical protein
MKKTILLLATILLCCCSSFAERSPAQRQDDFIRSYIANWNTRHAQAKFLNRFHLQRIPGPGGSAPAGGGGISVLGKVEGDTSGSGSSIATGSTINVASGKTIISTVTTLFDPGTITVSDGGSNSCTDAGLGKLNANGTVAWIQQFVCKNTTANATATWTASFSGSSSFSSIMVIYADGLSTSAPVDQTAADTGGNSASPVSTTSLTTTAANELFVCGIAESNTGITYTAGSGFTLQNQAATTVSADQTQIVSSIQTGVTFSMSFSPAGNFIRFACVTLK